ncbi:Centrosomal protein POC5, partial [Tetrabaena socialis]
MAGANSPYNPYLTGYQDYLPRAPERRAGERGPRIAVVAFAPFAPDAPSPQRADDQANTSQPLHPLLPLGAGTTRTASSAVVTAAPAAGLQGEAQQQPGAGATVSVSVTQNAPGGGSSIDIVLPSQAPDPASEGRATTLQPPNAGTFFPSMGAPQASPAAVEIMIGGPEEQDLAMGSHLEGLTVQQMLDLDIDSLAVKIDKHHCHTKKAVLDHFMETKARLMQSQNDAVDEERRRGAARLAAKEEELKLVLAELDAMRLKAQRLWELMGRACAAYGQAKERRRRTILQFQLFYSWREQAMILARRKRRVERAERWYNQVHLKRNVFRAWFREAMREHRVTVNNRYIQEVENAKRLIHDHYKGQLGDLERLLADSHARLEQEAEARARLEDNMKRAFMRGVCALNIEAMTIMKRGAPPGGANPFPISLPPAGEQRFQEQGPGGGAAAAPGVGGSSYGMPPPAGQPGGGGGYGMAAVSGQALMESLNLDLRGSITLSPTRMPPAQGPSAVPGGGAGGTSGGGGS